MKFVKFTEHNDHEGESWNFWLQHDGNETELSKLKTFLAENDLEDNPGYELDMNLVDEHEIDILVKHSDQGYMDYNNKVTGKFTMPEYVDDGLEDSAFEFAGDHFYKGMIAELFN